MSYRIEIAKDEDLYELMTHLWRCFEDPYQGLLRIFFPILNNDREASLLEASNRQREEYRETYPELIWLKVVDNKTNKIIAGAKWYFYERNPFLPKPGDSDDHDPTNEEAFWYPKGVGREFATLAMHAFEKPRTTMGQRPHSFLNIIFTLPEHQRKGVGRAILDWGLAKADRLGLESWLDASVYGLPLYQKVGFLTYGRNNVQVEMPANYDADQKAEWEHYKSIMLPVECTVMWRPAGGKFSVGKTITLWTHTMD
ncbi:putative GNAT family acetyltransferase [Talaromyces proteolyticus]|uniref:GNAT family acetyltransferase n=1 Tax=Talaromyces proteolyticus TaxID=1131652 RepID=A0AAD4KXB8_9EURO|nr:putative GNAT family acetyltransferase [Talaromyces proteolyticus]KAH8703270.1 putative GNAT family acetyltransferase [Talaromyces proteolyticus]